MLPENFSIVQIDESATNILENLFELYLHDMAEWFEFDTHPNGSYSYDIKEEIWDKGAHAYLLYAGEIPVGFAIINKGDKYGEPGGSDVLEFFIVRRYRRSGVGRELARFVWEKYPGRWVVRVLQHNLPAIPFWRSAVSEFTDGNYVEEVVDANGKPWSWFRFGKSDA